MVVNKVHCQRVLPSEGNEGNKRKLLLLIFNGFGTVGIEYCSLHYFIKARVFLIFFICSNGNIVAICETFLYAD